MEHKLRQQVFYLLKRDFDDDLANFDIEVVEGLDIVKCAIQYFNDTELGWVYPSKSYVVAICYSKWISKIWDEDFYKILNDPELLYNNDPYFVPYENSKEIYDAIISSVGLDFDETLGIIPDVKKYFLEEFMLDHDSLN
jgi:hypothetical protein